jgi:hypothetical protein
MIMVMAFCLRAGPAATRYQRFLVVFPELISPDFAGSAAPVADPFLTHPSQEAPPEEAKRASSGALWVQERTILLLFGKEEAPEAIRKTLDKYGLRVRAAFTDISFFVAETTGAPTANDASEAARLREILTALRGEPGVRVAIQNTYLGTTSLPRRPAIKASVCWDFFDDACSGTFALRQMKFPEAWNFNDAIERSGRRVKVGVVDAGFQHHDDLPLTVLPDCGIAHNVHGNAVSGVIAAKFDDVGLNGGSPFADLVGCAPIAPKLKTLDFVDQRNDSFASIVEALRTVLKQEPPPRVVNMSMGYNWSTLKMIPGDTPAIQEIVKAQGKIVRDLLREHPATIVVSSAGNDCLEDPDCTQPAKWTSPVNWAALGEPNDKAENAIVVEAANPDWTPLTMSNRAGMIRAIGKGLVTTALQGYGTFNEGTSGAAPNVTAAISLMLAYNPDLSVADIKRNLGIGVAGIEQPPKLDAFAAVSASRKNSIADLADLVPGPGSTVVVDRRDFEVFRKAFRQVHSPGSSGEDLNGDGVPDANDGRFCRANLNGDDDVDLDDFELLLSAWTDGTPDRAALLAELQQP